MGRPRSRGGIYDNDTRATRIHRQRRATALATQLSVVDSSFAGPVVATATATAPVPSYCAPLCAPRVYSSLTATATATNAHGKSAGELGEKRTGVSILVSGGWHIFLTYHQWHMQQRALIRERERGEALLAMP